MYVSQCADVINIFSTCTQPLYSLMYSQQTVTRPPYPEPHNSSPYHSPLILKIYFNNILPSTSGFRKWCLLIAISSQISSYPHLNTTKRRLTSQTLVLPQPCQCTLSLWTACDMTPYSVANMTNVSGEPDPMVTHHHVIDKCVLQA